MSNIVRDINIKNEHTTFSWYYQHRRFSSKYYWNRWKAIQKYSYLLHCISENQRLKKWKN